MTDEWLTLTLLICVLVNGFFLPFWTGYRATVEISRVMHN